MWATEREIGLQTTSKTGRARKVLPTNLGLLSPQNQPEIWRWDKNLRVWIMSPINMSDFSKGMEELVCRLNLWRMELFKYTKVCQLSPITDSSKQQWLKH